MMREFGYGFEVPLYHDPIKGEEVAKIKSWLRDAGILGQPTDNIGEYPDRVRMNVCKDLLAGNGAGGWVFQAFFKSLDDAMLFKLTWGGCEV